MLAIAFLFAAPTSSGATYDDPVGDVTIDAAGVGRVPGEDAEVDVIRVWIGNETLDSIEFGFETVEPEPTDDFGLHQWTFRFLVDGAQYELTSLCGAQESELDRYDDGVFTNSECLPLHVDENRRSVTIPKTSLLGLGRSPIGIGTIISDFQLEVYRNAGNGVNRWLDQAPDQRIAEAFVLSIDGTGIGGVQWRIDEGIQYSNGVLGLFSTTMHLINPGTASVDVHFEDTPPERWQSLIPGKVTVPAGTTRDIPIAFLPPGAHSHGDRTTWPVIARVGDETAQLDIGIDFFDVPQPAGHHPRIWLHGANVPGPGLNGATTEDYWINALEDDPQAEPIRISNGQNDLIGGSWSALLRPELLQNIALVPGSGTATVLAYAEQPVAGGSATLDIVYCDPSLAARPVPTSFNDCPQGEAVLLTRGTTTFDTQIGGAFELKFSLPVDAYSTIITTERDAFGMGLQMQITGGWGIGDLAPITIQAPGTSFELPLIDRAQARNEAESYGLTVEGWTPSACPADGGFHVVEVSNPGDAGTLSWEAIGSLGSRVMVPEPAHMEAGETKRFEIPVGSDSGITEDFGAIRANLDDDAFAWMTWLHLGNCPMGEANSGAFRDAEVGNTTPIPVLATLIALMLGAVWGRRK